MLNNDTPTIKLTDEQTAQIEEVEIRLLNLETEISIATKNLKSIKGESERAIKDKVYQEELLASVKTQVEEETKQLNYLTSEIAQSNVILGKLNDEINTKTGIQSKKDTELIAREAKIVSLETELSNQGSAIGKEKILLHNSKVEHEAKVAKLKEVISTF